MNKEFSNWKKSTLEKLDKSPKGSIDKKIKKLCEIINKQENMFTLSSCSGRIVLLENISKKESNWVYSTHNFANLNDIWEALENFKGDFLTFRQESVIMHICVSSFELAQQLMHSAKSCGFNQCGIISTKKIVVEIICDVSLITPVFNKKLLITKEYLEELVKQANNNQKKSWECISKLNKNTLQN